MDYRIYHAVNEFVADHAWLGRATNAFETWSVPLLGIAVFGLWLLARPGGSLHWKLASASALASAALALLVNQAIAAFWDRSRPYLTHPSAHFWGTRKHDASFPSDHASAAFAIGFAVLLVDRVAGWLFVAAAVLITIGRVVVGAHYPGDVAAGLLVGAASALLVVRLGRPVLEPLVRLVSRLTDPVLAPLWNRRARRASR
ncbi:MAG: phosphatase PAP2 family protein [Gaiellaceae bacterium]